MVCTGAEKSLGSPEIATISVFAFLKAVVCDHMNEEAAPIYSFEDRHLFRTTLAIPNGVQKAEPKNLDRNARSSSGSATAINCRRPGVCDELHTSSRMACYGACAAEHG